MFVLRKFTEKKSKARSRKVKSGKALEGSSQDTGAAPGDAGHGSRVTVDK